jgi:hypothetical protein
MFFGNQKILVGLQSIFVTYDLLANVCIDAFTASGLIQLVLIVFQLILLAMSLLLIFLTLFNTYPVQVRCFTLLIFFK